ncbi:MAG: hypothetical protein CFE37_04285 [Alphaproteobacteria bacterium PA4]|nr:MAG: hypothetical protein CFE37_04285 [Alphaproteobacteria bacterium PA4]
MPSVDGMAAYWISGAGWALAKSFILKPYQRRREAPLSLRILLFIGLTLVAALYGLFVVFLPPNLIFVPVVPILTMAGVCLWLLPDTDALYDDTMIKMLVWTVGLSTLWPNYVAVALPGLPWITPVRGLLGALTAMFVYNLATSRRLRQWITTVLSSTPMMTRLFWLFWLCTTLSLAMAGSGTVGALTKYINNQIYWTMLFIVAALACTKPGVLSAINRVLLWTTIVVCMIGLLEFQQQRVVWLDYLPSFLKVDPAIMATIADSQARAGTDVYRVRGTFAVSLYYAEFLGLMFPFFLHAVFQKHSLLERLLLALAAVAVAANMVLTNARSGTIALLLSLVVYLFISVYRLNRQHKTALISTAALYAYPAGLAMLTVLMFTWTRLRVMTLGGGQHQASTDTRGVQWDIGMPKVYTHPFGHGSGRAADVLGYANGAGEVTIDSYYLSLLLEYGFLGFLLFMLFFVYVIWRAFRLYIEVREPEAQLAGPICSALLNFIVVRSVLSPEPNMPIAFLYAGCLAGLIWRLQNPDRPRGVPQPKPAPPGFAAIPAQ